MSREISLAFSHPENRAQATAPGDPHDRISLRDHIVDVEIGAFQPERGRTQRVCFNVVVEVRPQGDVADDVDRVLSYDRITDAIAAELAVERLNLLETLAERVADRILLAPQALRCFVRIEKLDLGPGALGVEIVRSAPAVIPQDAAALDDDDPHPVVIFLSNAAIASDKLGRWIDAIEDAGQPAIFCVGPSDHAAPHAAVPMAQRRIDLLAIEQNAWLLAARDKRCVVVDSRTELDWACGKRRISVWAPSKMVLDATDTPPDPDAGPAALAVWLASHVSAVRTVFVGLDDLPDSAGVTVLPLETDSLI